MNHLIDADNGMHPSSPYYYQREVACENPTCYICNNEFEEKDLVPVIQQLGSLTYTMYYCEGCASLDMNGEPTNKKI